jgi:hypothetical protein
MTNPETSNPLRRQLLLYASAGHRRDEILAHFFPNLDTPDVRQKLDEAAQHRQFGRFDSSEQIVAELIKQDQEAR